MTKEKEETQQSKEKFSKSRRTVLKALAGVPVLGVFGYQLMANKSFNNEKKINLLKEFDLEVKQPKVITSNSAKGDLLRIGMIGFGNRAKQLSNGLGFIHPADIDGRRKDETLNDWLAQENLNIAITGICDVFDLNAEKGIATATSEVRSGGAKPSGLKVKRYRSYQEMLSDDSIDAVVVATPDHHHARITSDAVKAGKHVYCEKSIAIKEEELYEVYDAVKASGKVFQLGHQSPQNVAFQQAKQIIKKNILGKITLIEATTNRNTASGAWIRHLDSKGNPKHGDLNSIDWEQWLGNRPKMPFSTDRFYNWTKFFDYDLGVLGQLFTHEYDAINQLLGIGIPNSAVASGGIYYWKDNREIPDSLNAIFEYPEKELTLMYSANLQNSRHRGRVFMGSDASMELGGSVNVTADKDSVRYKQKIEDGIIDPNIPMLTINPGSNKIDAVSSATQKYYASRGLTTTYMNGRNVDTTYLHLKEWIDCIRSGEETTANIERAFEEGVTVIMAHKSYIEKRRVEWDPVKRKIV